MQGRVVIKLALHNSDIPIETVSNLMKTLGRISYYSTWILIMH